MKKIILAATMIMVMVFTGCQVQYQPSNNQPTSEYTTSLDAQQVFSGSGIKQFEDFDEAKDFLKSMQGAQSSVNYYGARSGMAFDDGALIKATSSVMPAAESMESVGGAGDYSETNVQVEGVDEADFVKNDDRYIYMISNGKLLIVDAYDAENARVIYEENLKEGSNFVYAEELFINGDKLVLFLTESKQSYRFNKYDIKPYTDYKQFTKVMIYDMSDRTDLKVLEEYDVSGNYYQSRMIGDKVYLITNEYTYYHDGITPPIIYRGTAKIMPELYYFPNPESGYNFNTVTSFNVDTQEVVDSKSYLLGQSNTLMMSKDNIYIAYQENSYRRYFGNEYEKERFYDVIVPLLEGDLERDVNEVISRDLDEDEEWEEIEKVLVGFFLEAEEDKDMQEEYEDMFDNIGEALDEYDTRQALEDRKTVIHKISADEGMLEYVAEGRIDGQLLNQFSMDEYEGNLRVATTVNIWTRQSIRYNNVYVLDENLEEIGKIENIAEDERIYSTRFLGDKLYMVTFKQTDPLFVIDLADPSDPEILGELKIPGFSNYLHPYKEGYLIGIGKETTEEKWGFTTEGVKIALFDVTDLENPKLVDKVEIGDSGSSTPVEYDHKAFMYSDSKELFVLPVRRVTGDGDDYFNSREIWYGAYAIKVSEDGFEKLGTVEHDSSNSKYYWNSNAEVKRSLYMDDNLYTISNRYLLINDLSNDLEELNTLELDGDEEERKYMVDDIMEEPVVESIMRIEG